MSRRPDIYLDMGDLREVLSGFAAGLGTIIEANTRQYAADWMRTVADSPHRTPAAATALRHLADCFQGVPPSEPAPDPRSRFKLVDGGGSAA